MNEISWRLPLSFVSYLSWHLWIAKRIHWFGYHYIEWNLPEELFKRLIQLLNSPEGGGEPDLILNLYQTTWMLNIMVPSPLEIRLNHLKLFLTLDRLIYGYQGTIVGSSIFHDLFSNRSDNNIYFFLNPILFTSIYFIAKSVIGLT